MRYTKQDANQLKIEKYLTELGFCVLRLSDYRANKVGCMDMNMHPLDLLVLGMHRKKNCPILSQWELKASKDADFTDSEQEWLVQSKFLYGEDVPVNFAYDVDDILKFYGWM